MSAHMADLPRGEYDATRAVNYSTLKHMLVSPRHYLSACTRKPTPPTPAMVLGSATHCLALEPDTFEHAFVVWEGAVKRGKEWEAFRDAAGSREILGADAYETARAIADAVRADPVAADYLRAGAAEQTVSWVDTPTGLACKGRLDWVDPARDLVVGLKTARAITRRAIGRACADFLYALQWAHYDAGYRAAYGRAPKLVEVCVETSEPHDVVCYLVTPDTLLAAHELRTRLLQRVAECQRAGAWPGMSGGEEVALDLEDWEVGLPREYEDEIDTSDCEEAAE